MGLGGGARFLLACLLQTLAVGAAFAGMDFGYPSAVLASLPYWGTALGALLIAGTASPRRKRTPEDDDTTGIPVAPPDDDFLSLDMPGTEKPAAKDEEDSSLIINIADFESPAAPEKQPASGGCSRSPGRPRCAPGSVDACSRRACRTPPPQTARASIYSSCCARPTMPSPPTRNGKISVFPGTCRPISGSSTKATAAP